MQNDRKSPRWFCYFSHGRTFYNMGYSQWHFPEILDRDGWRQIYCLYCRRIRSKEILIQNVHRQINCVQSVIDFITQQQIDIDSMATHNFNFKHADKAYRLFDGYKDEVIKAIIHFD